MSDQLVWESREVVSGFSAGDDAHRYDLVQHGQGRYGFTRRRDPSDRFYDLYVDAGFGSDDIRLADRVSESEGKRIAQEHYTFWLSETGR